MADNTRKDRANVQFGKLQRAEGGKKGMSDYETNAAAARVKTERLKALRLARDAAEAGKAEPVVAAPKRKSAKAGKGTSETLSAWLKAQQGSGRNN